MIGWALETFIAVNLLIVLVLLARRPVASLFGAGWAYALWALPLLRLIMPPLPIAEMAPILPSAVLIASGGDAAVPRSAESAPWLSLALAIWAGGAVAFILWQLTCYRRFLAALSASLRPSYPATWEDVPVLESRAVEGPVAIGLLDARIVVPIDFLSRYTPAEQRLALTHERIHHRRGDLWWNSLALLVLALNWFNPLAWLASRAFRADQELACDAAVARLATPAERHVYARALVKSASRPGLVATCPLNSADQLKRRLKMMKQHRSSRSRTLFGCTAVLGLFAAGLGFSAPTYAQDERVVHRTEKREVIIKHIDKDGKASVVDSARLAELRAKCDSRNKAESDVTSGEGESKFRTRVIICGDGDTAENRQKLAAALDRARSEMEANDHLSPEARAKALEALRREAERLRSTEQ